MTQTPTPEQPVEQELIDTPPHIRAELESQLPVEAVAHDAGVRTVRAAGGEVRVVRHGDRIPLDGMPSDPTRVIGSPWNPMSGASQAYGEHLAEQRPPIEPSERQV